MQQLNSLYRGDSSDSLSNIMGMQYQPQNQLNQFTSQLGIAGINNASATNRTAMQIASSEKINANQLRETTRANTLNYLINDRNATVAEGRLGMENDAKKFDQDMRVKDQTFNQQRDVARYNLDVKKDTRTDTDYDRKVKDAGLDASAGWDMRVAELNELLLKIPETDTSPEAQARRQSLKGWIANINKWRTDPNSVNLLRHFEQTRMSNPVFGLIRGSQGQTTQAQSGLP